MMISALMLKNMTDMIQGLQVPLHLVQAVELVRVLAVELAFQGRLQDLLLAALHKYLAKNSNYVKNNNNSKWRKKRY
jgi:hypothetical protein